MRNVWQLSDRDQHSQGKRPCSGTLLHCVHCWGKPQEMSPSKITSGQCSSTKFWGSRTCTLGRGGQ